MAANPGFRRTATGWLVPGAECLVAVSVRRQTTVRDPHRPPANPWQLGTRHYTLATKCRLHQVAILSCAWGAYACDFHAVGSGEEIRSLAAPAA